MKLTYVEMSGFRGYRKRVRIQFADRFTIVDGRNGVGKSTIFDAVEYALTGSLGKYRDAKASGETAADYLWWTGDTSSSLERYVEVGFVDGSAEFRVRRGQFDEPVARDLSAIESRLCDLRLAPKAPLGQLCAAAIIRDEHITSLSLDLKETDRYALLRDALGANDSDTWITRAERVVALSRKRVTGAQAEVSAANSDVAMAARRLDEIRAGLVAESVVSATTERLRAFANTNAPIDQLSNPVRERMGALSTELVALARFEEQWEAVTSQRRKLNELREVREAANAEKQAAEAFLKLLPAQVVAHSSSVLAQRARDLVSLLALGRQLGLQQGNCPLCATSQTHEEFEHGMSLAESLAKGIDEQATLIAEEELRRAAAQKRYDEAAKALLVAEAEMQSLAAAADALEQQKRTFSIDAEASIDVLRDRRQLLQHQLEAAQKDLGVLESARLSTQLERAHRAQADASQRLVKAQERFGRIRKAEANAQALHDSARRAASETLDRRLERVLPLMSELYRRLRPHPVWDDIEYSIRGDVRRFLTFRVGDDLNPQFLFSSGQRRATGLAFLLSVNLSLAWSRWRTILLDDPVQHVDDFRAIHLAEVMAQLIRSGRQVICAVEDAALADLMCRRLPIERAGEGNRVTLGPDGEGVLHVLGQRPLNPLPRNALTSLQPSPSAAS